MISFFRNLFIKIQLYYYTFMEFVEDELREYIFGKALDVSRKK